MHNLLQLLLGKKGIKDVTELEPYEKDDFQRWNKILSEGEITVDKIKEFCQGQIKIIENKYLEPDNSEKKDCYLKACLGIYRSLINLIEAPSIEKENLERYLRSLIK